MIITKEIIQLENESTRLAAEIVPAIHAKLRTFSGAVFKVDGNYTKKFAQFRDSVLDELKVDKRDVRVTSTNYSMKVEVRVSGNDGRKTDSGEACHTCHYADTVVYIGDVSDGEVTWYYEPISYEEMVRAFSEAKKLEEQAAELRRKFCRITSDSHTYFQ